MAIESFPPNSPTHTDRVFLFFPLVAPWLQHERLACLQLLQGKGLAKAAAHGELNAEGKYLIVAAGADGWSAYDVSALIGAGAHVATAGVKGRTGVWNSASCGHALRAVLDGGGDVICAATAASIT